MVQTNTSRWALACLVVLVVPLLASVCFWKVQAPIPCQGRLGSICLQNARRANEVQPAPDPLSLVEKFVPSLLNGVSVPDCNEACGSLPGNSTTCSEACKAVATFMRDGPMEAGRSGKNLVVVPLDFLASLVDHAWYTMLKRGFVDELVRSPAYQRLHGANHVLICLTAGCREVMQDLAVEIPNNLGSRAIWVGTLAGTEGVMWPCPLRTIAVPEIWDARFTKGFDKAVTEIKRLAFGKGMWECDSPAMPASGWDVDVSPGENGEWGGIVVDDYKFIFCAIPKCGSTMTKMLMRRIMGVKNWKTGRGSEIHSPSKNGLDTIKKWKKNELKIYEDDPEFVKVVVVRNPVARVLSGYLNKIVYTGRTYALPKNAHWPKKKGTPSFHKFVDMLVNAKNLDDLDHHFQPQSSFCGLRYTQKDFVAKLETMSVDIREFMESKGLWEQFGKHGWGEKGDQAFYQASIYKAPNHSEDQIRKYYDNKLLHKVYKLYKEDFDRFGYSIDEWLV